MFGFPDKICFDLTAIIAWSSLLVAPFYVYFHAQLSGFSSVILLDFFLESCFQIPSTVEINLQFSFDVNFLLLINHIGIYYTTPCNKYIEKKYFCFQNLILNNLKFHLRIRTSVQCVYRQCVQVYNNLR